MKNSLSPTGSILSVSSSPSDHLALRNLLAGAAGSVQEASNCAEAARWLDHAHFAGVICDDFLPDGGWQDVLALVASLPAPPPVIVTSRLADDRLWAAILEAGGYDLLSKPIDLAELRQDLAALSSPRAAAVQHAA